MVESPLAAEEGRARRGWIIDNVGTGAAVAFEEAGRLVFSVVAGCVSRGFPWYLNFFSAGRRSM